MCRTRIVDFVTHVLQLAEKLILQKGRITGTKTFSVLIGSEYKIKIDFYTYPLINLELHSSEMNKLVMKAKQVLSKDVV